MAMERPRREKTEFGIMARKKKVEVTKEKHALGTLFVEPVEEIEEKSESKKPKPKAPPKLIGYECKKCGALHKEKPMVLVYQGRLPRSIEGTCICGSRDFSESYEG
jgi:hypothetical protein